MLHLGDGDGKLTAAAGVLELFSTCPQSKDLPADEYRRRVAAGLAAQVLGSATARAEAA